MTAIKRTELAKVVSLVRPALSNQAYLPVLTHICFSGNMATAYNDVASIAVTTDAGIQGCIPGELLSKALQGFTGDTVEASEDTGTLLLTSGRSKLRLPTLPVKDFPFDFDTALVAGGHCIRLQPDTIRGIRKCLLGAGSDNTHPEQMGVTLEADGACAALYSTDNNTISNYLTQDEIKLPGRKPIILPTFLCEQVVSLSSVYKDHEVSLFVLPGGLLVDFDGAARVFTRMLLDIQPMDFPHVVSKFCRFPVASTELLEIPKGLDAALGRSLLVLGNAERSALFQIGETGFTVKTETQTGESHDHIDFELSDDTQAPFTPFYVDPSLMARAAKACTHMAFMPRAVVMTDATQTFVHLISHCSR